MFRRLVSPAVFVSGQSRFIYEYKFGQTPLTKPFGASRGQPAAAPEAAAPATAAKVEVTKLHNGVRVISQNTGGPLVSVGAYIAAGPAYDPASHPGVGSMMHLALTTSNYNNSLFQLDRNIRSVGAAQSHFEKDKHFLGIRVDVRADKWKAQPTTARRNAVDKTGPTQEGINLIQDNIFTCIAAPRFHETDIERFRDTIDNQLQELRWQYPAAYAIKMLETVAFYRESLGNPSFVPFKSNSSITSEVLLEQYSRYVVPSRIVIAGVNVEHNDLIAEYENCPFPHSASAPHHTKATKIAEPNVDNEQAQYTGGELEEHEDRAKEMGTKPDMDSESAVAVGWLAFGRNPKSTKDFAATLVAKSLLDIAFRDGVRYVKDETHVHEGVRAFYNPYNTAGLLGFTAVCEPQHAVKLVTDTVKIVQSKKSVSDAELTVAKQQAALQYLNQNTDNIRDYCDFLGTSLPLNSDSVTPLSLEAVLKAVEGVSAADVKKVFDLMFSKPTSLFGHGEMLGFPSLRQLGL
ncbi:metallo-peptidase, Clan ME, Family M16 [Angomonas deanei]|uniref:Peptidase M16 inactive domain containing protein, putative n=1 Tax=Angomonas deanei TaxID=59799 RepID=A0A7G2CJM0_9TRYP|nr:metallo-peptidase, Clan ME, Family M16 [Angomonas deanei]CAD2219589.1 Peptidase M16 inactive domain containing protein, putative [Angomonas deanei]|eukprot:EPY43386.1 metallo-peptidase, Clan ME, Family M16 [Angomonas deanei]